MTVIANVISSIRTLLLITVIVTAHPLDPAPSTLASSDVCSEPSNLFEMVIEARRLAFGPPHESFYQIPFVQRALIGQQNLTDIDQSGRVEKVMVGEEHCTSQRKQTEDNEEVCPIYYVINHDRNRYPQTIVESRCQQCRHQCRGLKAPPLSEKRRLRCMPVDIVSPVLRRAGCHGGVYQYRTVWEKMQVGCACQSVPVIDVAE